jgi:putative oxidoreductase
MIERAQDAFLLFFRCYWGYQFFQTGLGKVKNIGDVIGYFTELKIPFSEFSAYCVAGSELVGGVLLFFGLFARPVASVLSLVMLGAYYFADWDAVLAIFTDPSKIMAASPFNFLFASILVVCFGAGMASIDGLIWYLRRR